MDTPIELSKSPIKLGPSSFEVGPIAYGCWRFAGTDAATAQAKIETALECGMTLIDTADIYGVDGGGEFGDSEELLGDVFKAAPGLRDRMVLATKGGIALGVPYNSTRAYLTSAVDASLKRLKIDTIDLYQIHRPDLLAPAAEVADALTSLRALGKIKEVGLSNQTCSQFRALQAHLDFPLIGQQPEFSAWHQAPLWDGTLDLSQELGLVTLAWSPLGRGMLATGKPDDGLQEILCFEDVMGVLKRLADREETTTANIALAFVLAHPANVIPIIGTQTIERIRDSAQALNVRLTRRDWYDIVEARQGAPMP